MEVTFLYSSLAVAARQGHHKNFLRLQTWHDLGIGSYVSHLNHEGNKNEEEGTGTRVSREPLCVKLNPMPEL